MPRSTRYGSPDYFGYRAASYAPENPLVFMPAMKLEKRIEALEQERFALQTQQSDDSAPWDRVDQRRLDRVDAVISRHRAAIEARYNATSDLLDNRAMGPMLRAFIDWAKVEGRVEWSRSQQNALVERACTYRMGLDLAGCLPDSAELFGVPFEEFASDPVTNDVLNRIADVNQPLPRVTAAIGL